METRRTRRDRGPDHRHSRILALHHSHDGPSRKRHTPNYPKRPRPSPPQDYPALLRSKGVLSRGSRSTPDDVCANKVYPTVKQLERSPDSPRPLPHRSTNHPCRKVVFHLSSHDQGPGRIHENMYEHSWTWFDAEVIRGAHEKKMYVDGEEQVLLDNEKGETTIPREPDDPLLLPSEHKVQVNGARVSEIQDVEIVWDSQDDIQPDSPAAIDVEQAKGRGRATLDGQFVREMQVGDSIALWARARFPGWSNHVYHASVTVYWAV